MKVTFGPATARSSSIALSSHLPTSTNCTSGRRCGLCERPLPLALQVAPVYHPDAECHSLSAHVAAIAKPVRDPVVDERHAVGAKAEVGFDLRE